LFTDGGAARKGPTVFKKELRTAIWSLILISLGGWLVHLRIHPPTERLFHWIPAVFGALSTFVLPILFNYRSTVRWAFLLTVAAVIVGAAGMAFDSATGWVGPVRWDTLLLGSALPDILILLGKLLLAVHILRFFYPAAQRDSGMEAGE